MSAASVSDSVSDQGECHRSHVGDAWELEALARVPTLPREIQDRIVQFCDLLSLGALSRLNRQWREDVLPLLWRHLDFVDAFRDDGERTEATRRFFVQCEAVRGSDPQRFAALASHVRTLELGRLIGINIVQDANKDDNFKYFDDHRDADKRCVFDTIAEFKNLESLSVYIKNWWGYGSDRATTGKTLTAELTKLKSVKVGGQMPPLILSGLLAEGHRLTDISLINLISSPGQDNGPDAVTFLSEEECKRFTSLEALHLCKLAGLDGDDDDDNDNDNQDEQQGINEGADDDAADDDSDSDWEDEKEYASGMRWGFPRQAEVNVLEEWAMLLRHTSKTLRALTLENRYLCGASWQDYDSEFIVPGDGHAAGYGTVSIRESQRLLFPVLFNQEWPGLEELSLVEMGSREEVDGAIAHLKGRVRVEQRPARFQIMMGDVTPEEISTPVEF